MQELSAGGTGVKEEVEDKRGGLVRYLMFSLGALLLLVALSYVLLETKV